MSRFHFHIQENGKLIPDEEGQEFSDGADVRKEAVATGASIARDAFISGAAVIPVGHGSEQNCSLGTCVG
jgi:hypothetical protein